MSTELSTNNLTDRSVEFAEYFAITPKDSLIGKRMGAIDRLARITSSDTYKGSSEIVDTALIKVYGYSETEVQCRPGIAKHEILSKLIGFDLMLREFWDEDGDPSKYAEEHYGEVSVNPYEYELWGENWEAIKEEIVQRAPNPRDEWGWGAGQVSLKTKNKEPGFDSDDPVERYAANYGHGSILALPFKIDITSYKVSVDYVNDFQPPYGGNEYKQRVVYRPSDK